MIYLDNAATTPMSPAALDAYRQAAQRFFGNSHSLHDIGSNAESVLEGSRKLIASALGVPARGLYFTGSGSEASFLTLVSLARAGRSRTGGNHLITTQMEHSSVRNAFTWLEKEGFRVTRLPVRPSGLVDPGQLKQALTADTVLVSVQHVNSETGVIQPLDEIGETLSGHSAVFHSDMVQSFGKLPLNPAKWGIQSLSVSAHKIHGPKGIGACYISPDVAWQPFIDDTTHEKGFRPGTVDVPAAAAFAAAVKEAVTDRETNLKHVQQLKKTLIAKLLGPGGERIALEGDPEISSPYIAGLRIYGMEGQYAMLECSQKGVAISTGSACRVNEQKPSEALLAMGRSAEEAGRFIRLSFSSQTTAEETEKAAEILWGVLEKHLKGVRG